MTLFVCFWSTSSAFLAAMTSYLRLLHKYSLYFITWILNLRFLYVRTSTQAHITTVLKRSSYVYRIILVGLFYQLVNVNMLYQDYNGPGEARSNILLYQACYNPWAHFSKSLFKMIGISEIMVLALGWLNISCNIFLYRFLESHRKNNIAGSMKQIKQYGTCINFLAIRCTDIKKERKRNLIPAKVGIQSVCIVGGASILYSILLGLQVHKY